MIIKSNRVATTSAARRVVNHLFYGDENDRVVILQGTERDLLDAWRDARTHGAMKALRVWILAPAVETTREDAMSALGRIAVEFEFDIGRATVVEHDKERADPSAFYRHWHMAVAEVDAATGRVLSSSHDHARHEYLARTAEAQLGHPFVPGAHTKAVLSRLRREGKAAVADALDAAVAGQADEERPREAFTTKAHQAAKRKGIDLSDEREILAPVWAACTSLSGLMSRLAEVGLELAPGSVAGEWLVFRDGEKLGSLRRLTRTRKAAFALRMRELTDADTHDGRRTDFREQDLDGDGRDSGRTDRPAAVREPPGATSARAAGELHDGDNAPALPPGGGNGGNPSPAGEPACHDDRPAADGRPAFGHPGELITSLETVVQATFQLVLRAQATSMPAPSRVEALLCRYERAEKVAASPAAPTMRADIGVLEARERAASAATHAIADEIAALNSTVGDLLRRQRSRRKSWSWLRWFPDTRTDDTIAALREQRDTLKARHALVQRDHAHAIADEAAARRNYVQGVATEQAEYAAALAVSRSRLAILARARSLLRHVPTLAYVGAKRLIAMASRVERAREKGWDAGAGFTR